MLFSVVIPLYNKADVLERTLRSVLAQTYRDFETIVVDDGSTDGSSILIDEWVAIFKKEDRELRVVHQKNSGVSAARNKGVEVSRGDYVAMLDADDVWLPFHLADLAEVLSAYPNAEFFSTRVAKTVDDCRIAESDGKEIKADNIFNHPHGTYPAHSSTYAVKRSLLREVGGYDVRYSYYEDRELYYRLTERVGDFYYNTRPSALYLDDSAQSAHTVAKRRVVEYGYLRLTEERLNAGVAIEPMVTCARASLFANLPRLIVRRNWREVEEICSDLPLLSGKIMALRLLKFGKCMRPLVWAYFACIAVLRRLRG